MSMLKNAVDPKMSITFENVSTSLQNRRSNCLWNDKNIWRKENETCTNKKKVYLDMCVGLHSGSSGQKLICCAENFNELVGSAIKQVQEQKTALKYNLNETKRSKNVRQKRKQVGKHDKIFSWEKVRKKLERNKFLRF